jgi:predicted alpha/beta-hydrolase family hydrolase
MEVNQDEFIIDGPASAPLTLVLAHGAGAPMDSPFMATMAQGLAGNDLRVVRFEFPYMRARRAPGVRSTPDREPVLLDSWRKVIASLGAGGRLAIGGKSLGGRIASMVADEAQVRGLVCLGYPFHPPGKAPGARLHHLKSLRTPALIVQGMRDSFGSRGEVEQYDLSRQIRIAWIDDGDHSLKPRARSGRTEQQNLAAAIDAVRDFLNALQH